MTTLDGQYAKQRAFTDTSADSAEAAARAASWRRDDTVDYWRHRRMLESIAPAARHFKDADWLTVGDGRYGLDAHRLTRLYGLKVTASDLAEALLARGRAEGLIDAYRVENAEAMTLADGAVDVVFCKESFHHFARPMIALHEMLRVARQAVILLEPADFPTAIRAPVFLRQVLKLGLRRLPGITGRLSPRFCFFEPMPLHFEPAGNFVYTLAPRELLKVAHALALGGLAWKGFNDHYLPGCEHEPAVDGNAVFEEVRGAIAARDRRCRRMPLFHAWGLVAAILFKAPVPAVLRQALAAADYEQPDLAPNPYTEGDR